MLLIGIVIGVGVIIIGALATAAGQADWSLALPPKGCLAGGRVCVGMSAEQVFGPGLESNLGGLIDFRCGDDKLREPDLQPPPPLMTLIRSGCSEAGFSASFSDGDHLTGVWIRDDRVVRLQQTPRHAMDS